MDQGLTVNENCGQKSNNGVLQMNIKRAFLTAVAVLMVPGFAMAQSTVTFDVGVEFEGLTDLQAEGLMVEATVTCNAGIPLSSSAMVGQADADRVAFSVTEFTPGTCDVTFADVPYAGWDYDGDPSCLGLTADAECTAMVVVVPVDFVVSVDWDISEDADPGVGNGAMVEIMCDGPDTYTSTTLPAGPGSTNPVMVTVTGIVPPANCTAELTNVGSAVDANDCDIDVDVGDAGGACTITATAFYEGIPTLSQYGMAIMVLLMLGVGFVGFRRFV
ncbi:MAG: IPTL-CTERM sorting domain-containing protein [Xanthomonadales bacterium]|jgi:hypothetical protein|nr:IPTL-CTERM sorting domain-containing protein [Xanthomonadales bacterium]